MCVNSAVEPPTFLDRVPKTNSSPQFPALSLGRDPVHADLGALSELGLVRESLDTIPPSPHTRMRRAAAGTSRSAASRWPLDMGHRPRGGQ